MPQSSQQSAFPLVRVTKKFKKSVFRSFSFTKANFIFGKLKYYLTVVHSVLAVSNYNVMPLEL